MSLFLIVNSIHPPLSDKWNRIADVRAEKIEKLVITFLNNSVFNKCTG